MKKRSSTQSAFFSLRTLAGFAICLTGVTIAILGFGASPIASRSAKPVDIRPDVVKMVGPVSEDRDLRTLPQVAQEGEEEGEVRLTRHPRIKTTGTERPDPMREVRQLLTPMTMPAPIATYAGINSTQSACGCVPPDTNGDVGPNHYIQDVNSRFKILNKSGVELLAPTTYNTIFAALGGSTPCGTSNRGDGVVFYDHQADRWVITDFAFASFPGTSFYQCFAVSKTSDPVSGGWWLYAMQVDPSNPNYLGDYPKFGVWPDAYYMSVNMFLNTTTFNGVRVYALPRNDMINGTGSPNPGAVAFTVLPATLGDSYSLQPAGFRTGNPPPAGTPEYFLAVDSPSASGVVQTQVKAWKFHVDFATPANSTFGADANHAPNGFITVDPFVDAFTTSSSIVPQSGTTRLLDTLGDKIMYPLVYQNLNGTESLWASQTVNNNQNGTGPAAIRWYQFNVTGGAIPATPVQQQTFTNSADGIWRSQPSIAVDSQGNMAIAYSASASTIFPSIRYAGRLATDPLNSLAQGEAILQAGGGSQTGSSRWGDYSALAIDPADGATFWHTHEYFSLTSSSSWNTRIGAFRFPQAALALSSAVSRKRHDGLGTFDIPLPGVECRSGGGTGDFIFVFTFNNNVASGNASVTGGTGSLNGAPVISGKTMTVNLTGVTNMQALTVTLNSVTDVFGQSLPDAPVTATMLIGDTNGNSAVNASDVAQTKGQIGVLLDGTNFRTDVNTNGSINGTDAALVKAHIGESVGP